jgi:hypothetical protein
LYQKGRLAILNKEMENVKLAIFGVSEVRWNDDGSITTNGNLFIYSGLPGENEPCVRGVGILINKNIKDALLKWKPVSEPIVTAQINTKFRKRIVVMLLLRMQILRKMKFSTIVLIGHHWTYIEVTS